MRRVYAEGMYDTFASCFMPPTWKYERAGILLLASLNIAWLSRDVPLLGAPGTGLLCPFILWCSIKRIFPEYWTPAGQRGQQYPQLALGLVPEHWLRGRLPGGQNYVSPHGDPLVLYPGFLDKTNFPRILTPRSRYPQDPSTIPRRSRP